MIKNQHQYYVTKSWAEKFERAIASVRQNEQNDLDGWQLFQGSYQSQLNSLQEKIAEYETLTTHDTNQLFGYKNN